MKIILSSLLFLFILSFVMDEIYAQQISEFVTPILDDVKSNTQLPSNGAKTASQPNTDNISYVEISLDALSEPTMNLTIFDNTLQITHEETIIRNSTDYTYIGSTPNSKNNVFIAVFGDQARLEISGQGENYVLEPSGDTHIIKMSNIVDFSSASEGNSVFTLNPNYIQVVNEIPVGVFSSATHHNLEIDIVFLYTDSAINSEGSSGIRLISNLGVDKTNIALRTSGIPVHMNNVEIAGAGRGYVESGNMATDLNRLITTGDGYMERGNAVRNNENADIGILLNNHLVDTGYCGRASSILAESSNAFAVVNVSCTENQLSTVIAHELGHLFGMRHERVQDSSITPFVYGHGYEDSANRLTTIMGYPCSNCDWRNQWSDPSTFFERTRHISGTETHENNALVMIQTAPYIASFKGDIATYAPIDVTPPVFTSISNNILVQTDGTGTTVTFPTPIINEVGTITCDHNSGDFYPFGTTIVSCVAVDSVGNSSTSSFSIIVSLTSDTIKPILLTPNDKTIEATGILTSVDIGTASATDNLDTFVTITNDAPASFPLGNTVIIWTATDDAGNYSTASQTITIRDTTNPEFDSIPNNLGFAFTSDQSRTVTFTTPSASDLIDSTVSVSCTPISGTVFAIGSTTVTCTATDDSNNSSTITFVVLVAQSAVPSVTSGLISDTFDSSLDSWTYKETPNTAAISIWCPSALTEAYVLSHSTEHGGSAHTSNTNKCWFGSAGATKSFNFPANYNTLEISLDYKSLARIFAGIGHVNNIRVMVTDSSDMVLHTSNIYSGARSSGLTDTTWSDFTASISPMSSSQCPCKIFVYLADSWLSQWHQKFFIDNVILGATNIAPHSDSIPVNMATNSLNSADYLNMQTSNSTVVGIVNLFSDAIHYSWEQMPNVDYKVVISPASSPREKFADSTSNDSYTFVNLESSTLYNIIVGPRGDDVAQSHLQFMTLSDGQMPYDSQIDLTVNSISDGHELSWTDSNDIGNNRYIIERTVDDIPTNVKTIVSEPYLFVESSDSSWSGKTVSWKIFEYLENQKLYSNSVSVNIP